MALRELQRVRVHGLASRQEFNGRVGKALRYVQSKGRWEVLLDGANAGSTLAVRPENLEEVLSLDDGEQCASKLDDVHAQGSIPSALPTPGSHAEALAAAVGRIQARYERGGHTFSARPSVLLEESLLPALLAFIDSTTLLHVTTLCTLLCTKVTHSDGLWAQRVVDDFGGTVERGATWSRMTTSSPLSVHCRLMELRHRFNEAVVLMQGDLCIVPSNVHVDAVVCPAVPTCGPYGPCARAVHLKAGLALLQHLHDEALPEIGGGLSVGEALATPSFDFRGVRGIIHAVGPTNRIPSKEIQKAKLRKTYDSAFEALEKVPGGPARRVAVASISTGGNGVSEYIAAPVAMAALRDAVCIGKLEKVYMVLYDNFTLGVFQEAKEEVMANFNEEIGRLPPERFGHQM